MTTFDNGVTIDASAPIEMNHGGPAFPCDRIQTGSRVVCSTGISIRDYFAAKAMQALIASRHHDYENGWYDEEIVAANAYYMADAMLKARNTNQGEN